MKIFNSELYQTIASYIAYILYLRLESVIYLKYNLISIYFNLSPNNCSNYRKC